MVARYMTDPVRLESYLVEVSTGINEAVNAKYRVFCLTEDPLSTLMWSHYARNHSGICIEFNAGVFPFSLAKPVQYSKFYPTYRLDMTGAAELLTKSDHWAYEREWRVVAEERSGPDTWPTTIKVDDGFLSIPPEALTSITVGCLAHPDISAEICSIVHDVRPTLIVRQAHRAPDRYELKVEAAFGGLA